MKKATLLLLSSLLVSCAHHSPIYWGWGEWVASDAAGMKEDMVARFDWSTLPGVITSVDGNSVGEGFKKARMVPGKHVIKYAYYPAQFGQHPEGTAEMDLKAGHLYEFHLKLCFSCTPRKFAVWVEDKTIGTLVWGQHPDWSSWSW